MYTFTHSWYYNQINVFTVLVKSGISDFLYICTTSGGANILGGGPPTKFFGAPSICAMTLKNMLTCKKLKCNASRWGPLLFWGLLVGPISTLWSGLKARWVPGPRSEIRALKYFFLNAPICLNLLVVNLLFINNVPNNYKKKRKMLDKQNKTI